MLARNAINAICVAQNCSPIRNELQDFSRWFILLSLLVHVVDNQRCHVHNTTANTQPNTIVVTRQPDMFDFALATTR